MKLLDWTVGSSDKYTLHHRILNGVILGTSAFITYSFLWGEALDQPWSIQGPVLAIIAVFIGIYTLSRMHKFMRVVRPLFITFGMLNISLYYFILNGIEGEIPMYFIMGTMMSITIVKRQYYWWVIAAWVLAFISCLVIEKYNPSLVTGYPQRNARGLELEITTIGIMVLVGSVLILFKNLFDREQRNLKLANKELEQKAIELREAKEEADRANKAKSEFLSTMSHEIRTPLNAVLGMAYILQTEDPRPDQEANLKVLKFSGENLLALINDVLDYNKIESGNVILEDADFQLADLLESVLTGFHMKAEEKGIDLILEKPDVMKNRVVRGDSTRITQVLNNLVGNAVKFTSEGSVKLKLEIDTLSEDELMASFSVEDTGIGVDPKLHDQIFESFAQADPSITRKYGGTGLGLPISRELVHLMGGQLELTSTPGKGSTFSFELPLPYRLEERQKVKPVGPIKGDYPLKGKRILLAEDNVINAQVARTILSKWGAVVDVKMDGVHVVDAWKTQPYDIILMDLRMPEMDGIEATRIIRESENQSAHIPIVALTASAMLAEQHAIFEAGMNDYISKPFNPQELLSKIVKQTS